VASKAATILSVKADPAFNNRGSFRSTGATRHNITVQINSTAQLLKPISKARPLLLLAAIKDASDNTTTEDTVPRLSNKCVSGFMMTFS
jgi:hypothetical protein